MNTLDTIRIRKSVRSYQEKAVETDKIKAVAEAGNMAAATQMAGKVYFNVVSNREILSQLTEATKAVMQKSGIEMLVKISSNPAYDPIYHAPVAVVISTDKTDNPGNEGMAKANAACAGENMLLAATELGLGSCYLESPTLAFNDPAVCAAVKLPENVHPQAVIVFGYTDDTAPHSEYPGDPNNITYIS